MNQRLCTSVSFTPTGAEAVVTPPVFPVGSVIRRIRVRCDLLNTFDGAAAAIIVSAGMCQRPAQDGATVVDPANVVFNSLQLDAHAKAIGAIGEGSASAAYSLDFDIETHIVVEQDARYLSLAITVTASGSVAYGTALANIAADPPQ